jgi:hypothetical protein
VRNKKVGCITDGKNIHRLIKTDFKYTYIMHEDLDCIHLFWIGSSGCCKHCNSPLGSIKVDEFLGALRHYQLLKDSATYS